MDFPTLPLAELLMEKLQIVELNEKDCLNVLMLILDHDMSNGDAETINAPRIAGLCSASWGLWRTVTMNLDKIATLGAQYAWLGKGDYQIIERRVWRLLQHIEDAPKSMRWRARSLLGDRLKWYNDVTELRQGEDKCEG